MEDLEIIKLGGWDEKLTEWTQKHALEALEQGRIVYLPNLHFEIPEADTDLLSPRFVSRKAQEVSFDSESGALEGVVGDEEDCRRLKDLLSRFAIYSTQLVEKLFPRFSSALQHGLTCFHPVEIKGRETDSSQKNDDRLHVDAFPSIPVQGKRILRVYSNVNPYGEDRIWRIGEPFEKVAKTFMPSARNQIWAEASVLETFKVTKGHRTQYDHYMLRLQDLMKAAHSYQMVTPQREIRFPSGCTWILFSDMVSHAAISGQYALEQTLYLPVEAMIDPSRSPLRILEGLAGRSLA
jgi:hypothetical protein